MRVHSTNSKEVEIRLIENGFVVSYKEGLSYKEVFISDHGNLCQWLSKYYHTKG